MPSTHGTTASLQPTARLLLLSCLLALLLPTLCAPDPTLAGKLLSDLASPDTARPPPLTFKGMLADPRMVLVEFKSSRCGTCREFAPEWAVIERLVAGRVLTHGFDIDTKKGLKEARISGVLQEEGGVPAVRLYRTGDPDDAESLVGGAVVKAQVVVDQVLDLLAGAALDRNGYALKPVGVAAGGEGGGGGEGTPLAPTAAAVVVPSAQATRPSEDAFAPPVPPTSDHLLEEAAHGPHTAVRDYRNVAGTGDPSSPATNWNTFVPAGLLSFVLYCCARQGRIYFARQSTKYSRTYA